MKKGIVIGISIAIIVGIGAIVISGNYSENMNQESLDEDINEISLEESIKDKPKQFTVGLEESVGFSGG